MDRKIYIRQYIISMLKDALRCAKRENNLCAKEYLDYLYGMLMYANISGDISDDLYKKINNLRHLIIEKYGIH